MMKTCNKCKVPKELNLFSKRVRSPDGFRAICKTCETSYAKAYRQANLDKMTAQQRDYRGANKAKLAAQHKTYAQSNKDKVNAKAGAYRASKLNATPEWLTDTHKAHMKRTYALSDMMTKATGVPYHVDHIVPLNGENVCGLHVPWNLQALRADLNMIKSNKHDPQDNSRHA